MQTEQLGARGEQCASCAANLDTDQRYCLNCGSRRAGPRLDFERYMAQSVAQSSAAAAPPREPPPVRHAPPVAEATPKNDWTPFAAVSILAGLGVLLVIGVLIGRGNQPTVVNGPATAGTPTTAAADTATTAGTGSDSGAQSVKTASGPFKNDWPSGKTGYTVELGTLPKQGTSAPDVAAAKTDATGKGAADVGALDSDDYPSLPAGSYVLYSGVFDTKGEATKALKPLQAKFPDAKVVKVSKTAATPVSQPATPKKNSTQDLVKAGTKDEPVTATDQALNDLNNQSGDSYEDTIKKLPNQIDTEGPPAPINLTKPPGGSDPGPTTVIK